MIVNVIIVVVPRRNPRSVSQNLFIVNAIVVAVTTAIVSFYVVIVVVVVIRIGFHLQFIVDAIIKNRIIKFAIIVTRSGFISFVYSYMKK